MLNIKLPTYSCLVTSFLVAIVAFATSDAHGQVLKPLQHDPSAKPTVASVYKLTKTAKTSSDYSRIINDCRAMTAEPTTSGKDLNYLEDLLSRAHNRRGTKQFAAAESLSKIGNETEASTKLEAAFSDFESSVELDNDRWIAWFGLGNCHLFVGDYKKAIKEYSRTLELRPTFTKAMFNRAESNFAIGNYELALKDYANVIRDDHTDVQAVTGIAHCNFKLDEFEKAVEGYQFATRLQANDSIAQCNLGDAWLMMGEFKKAHGEYERATKASSPAIAYQRLGQLYASCPSDEFLNPAKAIEMARKAVENGGENSKNLTTLAAAQRARGNSQLAEATMEKAKQLQAINRRTRQTRLAELPESNGTSSTKR